MLTVIIAEKHIIEQYEQNSMLLAPFANEETVFCRWNCEGRSIEEMLPDLKNIISFNSSWRAVVVTDMNNETLNPFDFVHYSDYIDQSIQLDFNESFLNQCKRMFACYESSVSNPLTRISAAFFETPVFGEVIPSVEFENLLNNKDNLLRYIFKTQLEGVNTKKLAAELGRFRKEQLSVLLTEKNVPKFLEAITEKNFSVIFEVLSGKKLLSFLELAKLGNSTTYDPGYWMALCENTKKAQIYSELKRTCKLKNILPQEVLYLAIRTYDTKLHDSKIAWSGKTEAEYSNFVRYNLYNENISFLVYNMPSEDCRVGTVDVLKFQLLMQIIAMHGNSSFSIARNRLFSVDVEYDKREFNRTIAKLIARLKATALQINEEIIVLKSKKPPQLDNQTSRLVFETDVLIPVQTDSEYADKNLMVEHKLGLARNCPKDEMRYWEEQYYNICKLFKRFLREPRRSVKKACKEDFRDCNKISDIRAIALNENQKEDVLIKLEEEEFNMVSTVTSKIYETSKYTDAMQEADKNVRRGIKQRMTRKKTILSGLIAILAYFIGFLPLLFGNLNTIKSFLFSLSVMGIVIGVFAICGFVYLFVLKKRLINRFKHFNYVMSGICSDIRDSLRTFSQYLSHACMVMRESSVLKMADANETEETMNIRILRFNLLRIEREIEKHYKLLNEFSDESEDTLLSDLDKEMILPFDYDYTKQDEPKYEFYEETTNKEIDYMLKGHKVEIPMHCVNKVTLTREELYD